MAETEVIITQDRFGRDVTIPIDENGNIILYRATDDPSRIIDSDFRPLAKDKGSVGLGQQSYFSPNPMYSHKYQSSGRKNYKFVTQIKPNEILPTDMFVKNYPELVSALNIPEEYTNQNWRQLVNNDKAMIAMGYEAGGKRFFNDNIQTFIDNGIKAFGSGSTGTGGQTYIEYEIIPLVKEGDTLGIKPVATLQTKEGFAAGKSPEAFIETSLDTPTNVVDDIKLTDTPTTVAGAEVIDEAVDITESSGSIVDEIESIQSETLEKLRNSNDAFVAEQVDDIMARKINEVLPFVDTSLSRAEAIGISTTGPEITTSADPTLNAFIDDIEKITGETLDIKDKRKLRQFLYDVAKGNDNLLNDKKSFIPDLRNSVDNSKLNNPGYKIWKNWQHSGAFRPRTILDMTVNEYKAFGKPPWVNLVEGLDKSGDFIDFRAISDVDLDIPEGITDNWVDNLGKTTTNFVDNLPLETIVKNRVKNLIGKKSAQAATPGGLMDAVDVWEFSVLGLMAAAVAFKEYDEIPTIITNKAVDMFNSMTSFYGIPPVQKKEYDLDYEYITKVLDTGEKFMPTDIIIKKGVEEFKEGQESGVDISAGLGAQAGVFNNSITTPAKTDTMETTQKIQPGVQEEKMFEQARPKKNRSGGSGGGSGARIE